ncbi:MAG: hypothetical protein RBR74_05460 [Ignavibacteriaceae bacterium]|jgi:Trp operon repressor|nr:hypothetical protein [Ignavibacteriaceae bacterium]
MKIKKDISPLELRIELLRRNIKQRQLRDMLGVTDGAISRAIDNDKALKSLRIKIIKKIKTQNFKAA